MRETQAGHGGRRSSGHLVFGSVIAAEPNDIYMARGAAINDGVAEAAQALTVNLLCGF